MVDGFRFHKFNQTPHEMNELSSWTWKNALLGPTSRPHRKEFGPEDIHMLRNIKAQKAIEFTFGHGVVKKLFKKTWILYDFTLSVQ